MTALGARRVVLVVLDGVGVGALPDAAAYGDAGSHTLGNLGTVVDLRLPNLEFMGLGNIAPITGVPPVTDPSCLVGRLAPRSAGKDTTVGHWEQMGLVTPRPFPTYPHGFPEEVIGAFEAAVGRRVLGNTAASGTSIIAELGAEHVASGRPIVYTSADSVFQIAAHVDTVPLDRLYDWCRIARRILQGEHGVARVIARPFTGPAGAFVRTADRRDFSLEPPGEVYLDLLRAAEVPVVAVGKICEIFVGRGVTSTLKVSSNEENLALIAALLRESTEAGSFPRGLLFTNLVDFDMAWGHRNDVDGFAAGLRAVDKALPGILAALAPADMLILTADHGVDPTTASTDHSREYVPLLLYPRPAGTPRMVYEGGFADIGATVYDHLTSEEPRLAGDVITHLLPSRGWRRYTATHSARNGQGLLPVRLGAEEVTAAAGWLAREVGPAPEVAVVLGSGLAVDAAEPVMARVPFARVPHWPRGAVPGHPHSLAVVSFGGRRVCLLEGRVHEYEGFDPSEAQIAVRTLAEWGVRLLITTSASGAVATAPLQAARIVVVTDVLDCQYGLPAGRPVRLPGTDAALLRRLLENDARSGQTGAGAGGPWRLGVHASLPGPQYETPSELEVLRLLGAGTVSMSPAAEVRAAHDRGLQVAVLAVVVNAGDTTHEEVLAGAARARGDLSATVAALLSAWEAAAGQR